MMMKNGSMHMPGMDMMKMYFHAGYHEKNILFKDWNIDTIGGLIGSMFAFLVLSFLYEGLKSVREYLKLKELTQRKLKQNHNNMKLYGETTPLNKEVITVVKPSLFAGIRFVQAFLHVLQMFMGYLLMLAFMAFNAWLCIAILLGAGIGHFLFTWLVDPPLSDSADHCL